MGALPYKTNGNFIKTGALPAKRNFTSCVMRRSSLFVIKEHDYLRKLNFYYIEHGQFELMWSQVSLMVVSKSHETTVRLSFCLKSISSQECHKIGM